MTSRTNVTASPHRRRLRRIRAPGLLITTPRTSARMSRSRNSRRRSSTRLQDQRLRDVLALPRSAPADETRSSIINTASIRRSIRARTFFRTPATKAANRELHEGTLADCDETGVRVNAVRPVLGRTPLIHPPMPMAKTRDFGGRHRIRRAAQPVELAPLFVFLASNESALRDRQVYSARRTGHRIATDLQTARAACLLIDGSKVRRIEGAFENFNEDP